MPTFSQRMGLKELPQALASDAMTPELRASLWNTLDILIWSQRGFVVHPMTNEAGPIVGFARMLWYNYFKKPFSDIPGSPRVILVELQEKFFACPWNEVYDFIEAVVAILGKRENDMQRNELQRALNHVLSRELAAYRLVSGVFVQITVPEELAAVQEAVGDGGPYAACSTHVSRALELLSDRTAPDYRNSIKESISAVEAAVRIRTGDEGATLGKALNLLEKKHGLHGALAGGFSKLYGYTSDEGGIRHSLMADDPAVGVAEAKFFVIACSAFVNYLKSRI